MASGEANHLIAVIGGKGGVGKSIFAANLACTLTSELRAPALLMDLDEKSCGDQNFITGLRPQKTIRELVRHVGPLNPQALNSYLAKHQSGFFYGASVLSPDQNPNIETEALKSSLNQLLDQFKFIVADLGNDIGANQLAVIEKASVVLVISTPEVLVVNQTRRLLNDMMTATFPQDLFQIVLNRVQKSGLDPKAIGQALRRPLLGLIPQDDITAMGALQRSTPLVLLAPNTPIAQAYRDIVRQLSSGILQKLKAMSRPKNAQLKGAAQSSESGESASVASDGKSDPKTRLKLQVHHELIKEMDLKKDLTKTTGDEAKEKELRQKTQRVISQLVDRLGANLGREERSQTIKEVLDEALGLGALEDLLDDPAVSEIMVNGHKHIYVERNGKLTLSPVTFTSNLQLRNVIERIVTPLGRRIDEKSPYVDARLADGSRVNAVIEPLSIDGPAVTIRKFPSDRIIIDDYVGRFGSLTQAMADFLKLSVQEGLNVIISGGTGSGKTTLLNVMSGFIPANERIITVEDAAELQLKQEHVVRLETRPANMEGSGEVSIRDLIKNSLRMRPDRIVVGECRDGAALDMLAAMNTGHDGSMTTVHANNPKEAVARLETLCMMAGMELPAEAIRSQIAGAVNLIVQISRLSDGSRKIMSITEVVGMQGDVVTLQEVFRFKEEGFDMKRKITGQFQASGLIPTFIEKFKQRGVHIPDGMFTTEQSQKSAPAQAQRSGAAPAQPQARPATSRPGTAKPLSGVPKKTIKSGVIPPRGLKKTGSDQS